MPPSVLKLIAAFLVVVVLAVGAMFAVDAGRSEVIADGIRVGAVDVSGLSRADARTRLTERLLEPLNDPIRIDAAGRHFLLTAREAHIRADVGAMVDAAIARGREGGVLARTWRAISGEPVDARVAPEVEYSTRALQRLIDRVRVSVSRSPVDAKVDFKPNSVTIRAAREGRTIDAARLRERVRTALVSGLHDRTIVAPVQRLQPQITSDKLADKYPVVLTIDRANFRLTLFKDLERAKTYRIAVGQVGLETPSGLYKIENKAVNPAWHVPNSDWAGDLAGKVIPGGTPENPIKSRWLGVYDGVGVHGTSARNSIGTNASHGCIRMLVEDVEKLYDEVPVGTPIYIA